MGMTFETAADVPDFGSICLVDSRNGYKSYRLLDSDVSKLNLITNAANGSDALTDAGRMFIKLSGIWTEVDNDE